MSDSKEYQVTFKVSSELNAPKFKPGQSVLVRANDEDAIDWVETTVVTPLPCYRDGEWYWCYLYEHISGQPELSQIAEDDLVSIPEHIYLVQQMIDNQQLTLRESANLFTNLSYKIPEVEFTHMARHLKDAKQTVPTDNLEIAKAYLALT